MAFQVTYDVDSPSPIPAAKMYHSLVVDGQNVIPKALPHAIKSVEFLVGDGSVGTIKLITFVEEDQVTKSVKHNVDILDTEKLTYGYSITEGEFIAGGVEKISYFTEVVASEDGGCVVKNSVTITTNGEIAEEEINMGKERLFGLCKAVEGYVLANPYIKDS